MNNGEHKTIEYSFYKRLGHVLAKERQKCGLSLSAVAKSLKTSKTTIDNWELGKTRISSKKFKELCKVYGISNVLDITVKVRKNYERNY